MSIRKGRLTSQGVIAAPNIVEYPVGTVLAFAGPNTAIPEGYLLCNGAAVDRTDFADLFDVIGTKWGHGNTTTTFNIPTTQGLLLRGVAYGSGNDPDRGSRNAVLAGGQTGDEVGSFQNWRVQSHTHLSTIALLIDQTVINSRSTVTGNSILNSSGNAVWLRPIPSGGNTLLNASGGHFNGNFNTNSGIQSGGSRVRSTGTGGNQTVGQNVYMNFIIKY